MYRSSPRTTTGPVAWGTLRVMAGVKVQSSSSEYSCAALASAMRACLSLLYASILHPRCSGSCTCMCLLHNICTWCDGLQAAMATARYADLSCMLRHQTCPQLSLCSRCSHLRPGLHAEPFYINACTWTFECFCAVLAEHGLLSVMLTHTCLCRVKLAAGMTS